MPHHVQHGYMVAMPHLSALSWTFKEELQATAKQAVNSGIPETTYYVYDSNGQRARKITENSSPLGRSGGVKDERIYIGSFELYRNSSGLERETLHIMDDKNRIAMIDTEVQADSSLWSRFRRWVSSSFGGGREELIRYQLGNHLGSASLELNENAQVISYEEYHPYGTTAYQAKNATIKAAAKRYRYTGMERDEESGFSYHSARYYLSWLGRWLSSDPGGLIDGTNLYQYSRNNPIVLNDPNGMDPPSKEEPFNLRLYLPQLSPLRLSGNVQVHDAFSSDRSVSGQLTLDTSFRTGFGLGIPRIGLNTVGFIDGSGSATVNTEERTGQLSLRGGSVLGVPGSGLNLVVLGSGTFQVPVPERIQLNQASQTFLTALPHSTGNVNLHGDIRYSNFLLAGFSATGSYNAGQFTGAFNATSFGGLGRLHLDASGNIDPTTGQLSQLSLLGSAGVRIPLLANLSATGSGTLNETGGLSLRASADLRLFGLPSLHAEGTGTANAQGIDFRGSFSGAGPLYTSYIRGDFSLSSSSGFSANAFIAGITYTPKVSVTDTNPPTSGMIAAGGEPKTPWTPEGLTLGASFFNLSHGNLSHVSGGIIPELNNNIFTNLRVGATARFFF
jgi:RHS repeat-associated protein